MTSKNCTSCSKLKPLSAFRKNKKNKYRAYCLNCEQVIKKLYRRSKQGVASVIYGSQRRSSKLRGHDMPDYTLDEFRDWLFNSLLFHKNYDLWVTSGYLKMEKPSVDRINDYLPYKFSNIQIMTWGQNHKKAMMDKLTGVNNKNNKAVIQLTVDSEYIAIHHSMSHASRITGICLDSISTCCLGKSKTAGGFKWALAQKIN